MSNDSASPTRPRAPERRSNSERTEATRHALLAAARKLFVEKGYADTATPDIVAAANLTRGALYHHFEDKTDLFRAVILQEAQAVADAIDDHGGGRRSPLNALIDGADAWFDAMRTPGRTRLLLIDGPSVLGHAEMGRIDSQTGGGALREGLAAAIGSGASSKLPFEALAEVLSAAFDRAALAIAEGRPAADYKAALKTMLEGLAGKRR